MARRRAHNNQQQRRAARLHRATRPRGRLGQPNTTRDKTQHLPAPNTKQHTSHPYPILQKQPNINTRQTTNLHAHARRKQITIAIPRQPRPNQQRTAHRNMQKTPQQANARARVQLTRPQLKQTIPNTQQPQQHHPKPHPLIPAPPKQNTVRAEPNASQKHRLTTTHRATNTIHHVLQKHKQTQQKNMARQPHHGHVQLKTNLPNQTHLQPNTNTKNNTHHQA